MSQPGEGVQFDNLPICSKDEVVNVVQRVRWRSSAATIRGALGIIACAVCAVAAFWLASMAAWDNYLTGFPDSHFTDYDKAAIGPKRVLEWAEWGFVLVFVVLAFSPISTRARVAGSLVALVALVAIAIVQLVGIPWYFLTHLGLDNGIGG
jgi:hypothetical protein